MLLYIRGEAKRSKPHKSSFVLRKANPAYAIYNYKCCMNIICLVIHGFMSPFAQTNHLEIYLPVDKASDFYNSFRNDEKLLIT